MISFNFNYLLKALSPNTITWRLGLQVWIWGGKQSHSMTLSFLKIWVCIFCQIWGIFRYSFFLQPFPLFLLSCWDFSEVLDHLLWSHMTLTLCSFFSPYFLSVVQIGSLLVLYLHIHWWFPVLSIVLSSQAIDFFFNLLYFSVLKFSFDSSLSLSSSWWFSSFLLWWLILHCIQDIFNIMRLCFL